MPQLILASASKQRQDLLRASGIAFEIMPSAFDEKSIREKDPSKLVVRLAHEKAHTVARHLLEINQSKLHSCYILAADTVLVAQDTIFEKPRTKEESLQMLGQFQGREISAVTGVCLLSGKTSECEQVLSQDRAQMRALAEWEMRYYVETQPTSTWAGGISPAYPAGANLIESIAGSLTGLEYGLPMEKVLPLLYKAGFGVHG